MVKRMKTRVKLITIITLLAGFCQADVDVSILRNSLVGYWKMNDNEADTVVVGEAVSKYDSTGENQNGVSVANNTEDMNEYGRVKDAMVFNGSSDYLKCGYIDGVQVPDGITCTGLAYDPTDDSLWIGSYSSGKIYHCKKPTATQRLDTIETFSGFTHIQGIAYDTSDDTLWWSDMEHRYIKHINKSGEQINGGADDIDCTGEATTYTCGCSYEAATDSIWVCDFSNHIIHYSCADGSHIETFTMTGNAQIDGCCYDTENDYLYISVDSPSYKLLEVDASDGSILNTYNIIAYPEDICLDPTDDTLWILSDASYHGCPPKQNANRLYNITKSGGLINGITDEFSVAAWIKPGSITGDHGIVGQKNSSAAGKWQLYYNCSGSPCFGIWGGGT